MQRKFFKTGLILCCSMLAGNSNSAGLDNDATRDEVVARMGKVELRATEVSKLVEAQSREVRMQIESDPAALERMVRKELVRRAVLQEARQKEWDKRPEVAQKMEIAKEQVMLSTYVNNLARPPAGYPSEEEIKAAYKDGKDTFKLPSQGHAAQIYVAPSEVSGKKPAESDQAKTSATLTPAPAKKGNSAEPAIKNDGISTAIRSGQGWHIEMKAATPRELADVRENIVQTLRWRKAQENEIRYLEDVASRAPIEINQAGLKQASKALKADVSER